MNKSRTPQPRKDSLTATKVQSAPNKNRPTTVGQALSLAQLLINENRWGRMLEILTPFKEKADRASAYEQNAYYRLYSLALLNEKRVEELEEILRSFRALAPDSLDLAYLECGLAALMREHESTVSNGIRYLRLLGEKSSNEYLTNNSVSHGTLCFWLGEGQKALGNYEEARDAYNHAIKLLPENQRPYLALVSLLKATDDTESAEKWIATGIGNCPENTELRILQDSLKKRPTISACMIVRNEETMLSACLDSIRDWVDEIILVDTGSTDRTPEIASEYRAKIYHQQWQDDFSFHRNYSISQSNSDWILIIDADERIPREDVAEIKSAIGDSNNSLISLTIENVTPGGDRISSLTSSVRLFKRELGLKYNGIVHNELVLPPNERIIAVPSRIRHLGYNLDLGRMSEKFQRTKRLLEKQVKSEPNNPFASFNYAQQLCNEDSNYGTNNATTVIDNANKTIELSQNERGRRHLWMMSLHQLARAYFNLQDYQRARNYCLQAVAMKPNYLDVLIQAGFCSVKLEEYDIAADWFKSYLNYQKEFDPIRDTESLIIWHYDSRVLVLNNLGLIAEMSGAYKEAGEYYRQVLELDPEHDNARTRLNAIKAGQVATPLTGPVSTADPRQQLLVARQACFNHQPDHAVEILCSINKSELNPEQALEYYRLSAHSYLALGRFVDAEHSITAARSEGHDSIDFDYVESQVKLKLRDYTGAGNAADSYLARLKAKTITPEDISTTDRHVSQLYDTRAVAKIYVGTPDEARDDFEEAIRQDRGNQSPYLGCVRLLRSRGEYEQADKLLAEGIKHCSDVQELRLMSEWSRQKVSISACMIVKDEEKLLPGCLDSIRDWVNEIVIVDTGSSDRTVEIAKSYGAKALYQQWEGDFSKHRNYSIEQATSDWVFIIDADERFEQEDISKLLQIVNDPEPQAISINVFNYYQQADHKVTSVNSLRFFRRELNLRYEGIVHNQINIPEGLVITRAPISLRHLGYDLDPEAMARKFERTRALLEEQLEKNPEFAFGWFNLAQLYRGHLFENPQEYGKKIIAASTKAIELTSAEVTTERYVHLMALDQLAWTCFYLERYSEAEKWARRALEHKSDYLDPLMLLGHIYAQSKRYPEAIAAYQNYLDTQAGYDSGREFESLILIHPDSRATAYFGIGSAAEMLGNLKLAKESYLKAHEATPGYLQVPLCLGRIFLNEGDLPQAEKYLKMQLEKKEPSVHALLGLAHLYTVQSKEDEAEQQLLKALNESPLNPNVLSQMAEFYTHTSRHSDAYRLLRELHQLMPDDSDINRRFGDTCFSLGSYHAASEIYRKLLVEQPENSSLLNDLANCCFKTEQFQEAERLYRQALTTESADVIALRNLGLSLVKQNKPQEGAEVFEKYLNLMPNDHQIRLLLGNMLVQIGRYGQALGCYESYLKENSSDSGAMARIADCYLLMGHEDSALVGYRQALAIDPGCRHARQRLDQLQVV
ncbi:MAG: tetratricopeptide repeat protein [bacterium]|nr:tetratricopeptide repeat protein [bacterium]